MEIKDIKNRAQEEIEKAPNLKELDGIYKKYLGNQGEITQIFRSLIKLPKKERVKVGKEVNELKDLLELEFNQRFAALKEKEIREIEKKERLDVTIPGRKLVLGRLHPLTKVEQEVEEIFERMGFSVVEGPEVETEYYNFDALNIPRDHPARDMWDTFWLEEPESKSQKSKLHTPPPPSRPKGGLLVKSQKLLLRTHTSPVQVRYMEKNNPPLRIIVPGRCFRHEATDASHNFQFYQVEGFMVDKKVTAANFKAIIQEFFQQFFRKPVQIRLRPSYFPFTEPSFEVDMSCLNCLGRGCPACQNTGWMEMLGAGMVHPAVFKNAGLVPRDWQGFAFGLGLDRLAMMKYKIDDIRLFYSEDLKVLQQF